ncbi:MAG: integrase arm-type DNA-binding domain-containing protein [Methyloversatilis sp.]|jgi:integrase|nr:integrase arm-type DNA-binding domain-containing protein [Methyloversatilis sp.]
MATNLLSEAALRNAKPKAKPYKLNDGAGLALLVQPNGSRWWRLRYSFGGKEKMLSLGVYPDVPTSTARRRAAEARALIAEGRDPSEQRQADKAEALRQQFATERAAAGLPEDDSFEEVAREWFEKQRATWADNHAERIIRRLERDLFPGLGRRAVGSIDAPDLLAELRKIEARGAVETAHRALQNAGQVFRYAIATGRAKRDPSGDLKGALPPVKVSHMSAITDPKDAAGLLRAIDAYRGSAVTRAALNLAPLVFVRPGELRKAEWSEIDLDGAQWNIPKERMKMREPHLVPLSAQAVATLRDIHALTGSGRYVFPGARSSDRPMSDNTILGALRRMGFGKDEMSGHGFRALARTILDEVLGVRPDYIEHQLAHAVRDPNGRAYNRTAHLAERRKMMQQWADYLDRLKAGADVIPLHAGAA